MADKWSQYAVQQPQGNDWSKYAVEAQGPTPTMRELTPVEKFEVQHPDITAAGKAIMNVFGGIGASVFKPAAVVQQMATGQVNPTLQQLATPPEGMAGGLGNVAGQAAQFLIPGAAEEKAAAGIRGMLAGAPAAVRETAAIAPQVASTAAINKLQGGTATGGAIAGATGGALGKLAEAAAPGMAESAVGIGNKARAFEKTPAKAILEETQGYHPGAVAASANARIQVLNQHLEAVADATPGTIDTTKAMSVLDDAYKVQRGRGNKAGMQYINDIRDVLTKDPDTGQTLGPLSVRQALEKKRGVGDLGRWNPNVPANFKENLRQKVYRALDSELDAAMPGTEQLNQQMSSLIEVRNAAAKKAREAGIAQRSIHRIAAHTGAAVLPGWLGYREGGITGAITGATLGTLGMEAAVSPAVRMWLARNAPAAAANVPRVALPALRGISGEPNGQ